MAAAVTLADKGAKVTVFEAGPVAGGRARRVSTGGRELDNGQHILIGAYTELLRLMALVGTPADALLRVPLELRYADGFAFRSMGLPAPLGVLLHQACATLCNSPAARAQRPFSRKLATTLAALIARAW